MNTKVLAVCLFIVVFMLNISGEVSSQSAVDLPLQLFVLPFLIVLVRIAQFLKQLGYILQPGKFVSVVIKFNSIIVQIIVTVSIKKSNKYSADFLVTHLEFLTSWLRKVKDNGRGDLHLQKLNDKKLFFASTTLVIFYGTFIKKEL